MYEEPEKFKLWDTNVAKTKLLSNLSGNSSKIYVKTMKSNENPYFPETK
jgi:hypothetical protein